MILPITAQKNSHLDGRRLPGGAATSVQPRDPDSESVCFIFYLYFYLLLAATLQPLLLLARAEDVLIKVVNFNAH